MPKFAKVNVSSSADCISGTGMLETAATVYLATTLDK